MSPTGTRGGGGDVRLAVLLSSWADRSGYIAFGPAAGFMLANRDVLAPDGALVKSDRWAAVDPGFEGYVQLVPEVVVEVLSTSDSLSVIQRKCERWHEEGAS